MIHPETRWSTLRQQYPLHLAYPVQIIGTFSISSIYILQKCFHTVRQQHPERPLHLSCLVKKAQLQISHFAATGLQTAYFPNSQQKFSQAPVALIILITKRALAA